LLDDRFGARDRCGGADSTRQSEKPDPVLAECVFAPARAFTPAFRHWRLLAFYSRAVAADKPTGLGNLQQGGEGRLVEAPGMIR